MIKAHANSAGATGDPVPSAALGAGVDIHVVAQTAGLHNQLEPGELFDQRPRQMGTVPVQHNHVRIFQSD
jgi:hypothetical protein